MKKKVKKGMCWHEYHRGLISYCFDPDKRVRDIRKYKPEHEIKPRIKWFRRVKGKLPDAVVRAAKVFTEADTAYDNAGATYDNAVAACDRAWAACDKAACDKAWVAYNKTVAAYDKARAAYEKAIEANKVAIEELHKKECPNCPWNGKELVF